MGIGRKTGVAVKRNACGAQQKNQGDKKGADFYYDSHQVFNLAKIQKFMMSKKGLRIFSIFVIPNHNPLNQR